MPGHSDVHGTQAILTAKPARELEPRTVTAAATLCGLNDLTSGRLHSRASAGEPTELLEWERNPIDARLMPRGLSLGPPQKHESPLARGGFRSSGGPLRLSG